MAGVGTPTAEDAKGLAYGGVCLGIIVSSDHTSCDAKLMLAPQTAG